MNPQAPSVPVAQSSAQTAQPPLSLKHIFNTWWPLATGWLVMTTEIPMLAAFVARAPDPAVHLAAWGLVFPIALILASPVMMLLAASTALSKDWASYAKLRRYMFILAVGLTSLHALLAFTPLYDWLVVGLIAPPPEIIEPARTGLRILLPWSFALAYRRFNNGVLIRFGHPRVVTVGALVRLATDLVVLAILFAIGGFTGIVLATAAIVCGVLSEAVYAGLRVQPVLREELRPMPPVAQAVTLGSFTAFYVPLVMTSLLQILVQPIATAALSRMPAPLESLAAWPVIYGLLIMLMSAGLSFIEAAVVLLDEPRSLESVRRFTLLLALAVVGLLTLVNVTPLAALWLRNVAALPPELAPVAQIALWIGLPIPGLAALEAFFQGTLLHTRRTRAITEAVLLGLAVNGALLVAGVLWGSVTGIYVGMAALTMGYVVRSTWFWVRTRPVVQTLRAQEVRDY